MEAAKKRGLLWSGYSTPMSLLLKVISLVSCRKASVQASAIRHSIPASKTILTKASVAILRLFAMSSNWSNKFLNKELFCKVVMAVIGSDGLSSLSSPKFA